MHGDSVFNPLPTSRIMQDYAIASNDRGLAWKRDGSPVVGPRHYGFL